MSVRSSLSLKSNNLKRPKEVARLVDFLTTATRILMTVMMMMSLWCRVYLTENCLAAPSRVPALVAALQSPRNLRPLCVDQFFLAIVCATSKWSAFSLDDRLDYVFLFRPFVTPTAAAKQWTALLTLSAVILSVAKIWKSHLVAYNQRHNNVCRVKRSADNLKSSTCFPIGRHFRMNENIFKNL